MKRVNSILIVTAMLMVTFISASAASAKALTFSDVKASSWYKSYVDIISSKGITVGIGKGKFGPNNKVQVDELLTWMVKANNLTVTKQSTDKYWGSPYIRKAIEKGWVQDGEFENYKVPITRGEIARVIARAMPDVKTPIDLSEYKNMFKDYNDIDPFLRDFIVKVRAAGIIAGYYDAKYDTDKFSSDPYKGMVFGADKTATRAEASTMIVNYLTPTIRKEPSVVIGDTKAYYNGFVTGVEGVNTVLFGIEGIPEDENTNRDYPLVMFNVVFWKDYKAQPELAAQGYKEAKEVLTQKIDEKTVDEAIAYAKTKTNPDIKLARKEFISADKKYYIDVDSNSTFVTDVSFAVYYNK